MKHKLAEAYGAWHESRGKTPKLFLDLMAEDIDMQSVISSSLNDHSLQRGHAGRDAALEYFTAIAESWEMLHCETGTIIAEGDRYVWLGQVGWRNRKTLRSFQCPKVDIWTFAGEKAVSYLEMIDSCGWAYASGMIELPPGSPGNPQT